MNHCMKGYCTVQFSFEYKFMMQLLANLINESCLKTKVKYIIQSTVYSHVLSFLRHSNNLQPLLSDSRLLFEIMYV
jgi:hypothetical protein